MCVCVRVSSPQADNKYVVEYAKTGRAKCKLAKCSVEGKKIGTGDVRVGKMTKNPFDEDGDLMANWYVEESAQARGRETGRLGGRESERARGREGERMRGRAMSYELSPRSLCHPYVPTASTSHSGELSLFPT